MVLLQSPQDILLVLTPFGGLLLVEAFNDLSIQLVDTIEQAQTLVRGVVREFAAEQIDRTRVVDRLLESLNSVSQPTK